MQKTKFLAIAVILILAMVIPVFADENNVGDLIQRLFDSWHELNDLVEDIHQRTDR